MIIYLRCAETLTWVFSPFKVGVGTYGIGVQPLIMTQFKQPDKLVYNRYYWIHAVTLSRNQRVIVYTTVKGL